MKVIKKIKSGEEGISHLKNVVEKWGIKVGYVVILKYVVARCKIITPPHRGIVRSLKLEGSYREVIENLKDWVDDKREIYNLEEDEVVPCFEISISKGILVRNKKAYNESEILVTKDGLLLFRRAFNLFNAALMSIEGEKYKTCYCYKNPPKELRKIGKKPLDVQITAVERILGFYKKYRNKKLKIFYSKQDVIPFKNVSEVPILIAKTYFWGCYKSDLTLSSEEQKPIMQFEQKNIYDCVIICYDFEFSWMKKGEAHVSQTPSLITCVFFSVKHEEKIYYTFKKIPEFLDFLLETKNCVKYMKSDFYCIAHNSSSTENILLMGGLSTYIRNSNYEIKSTHITSTKIHSFTWKGIKFRDSMMYFPGSLKKFAESMEVTRKKEINIDWDRADWSNPTQEMMDYAMGDSISLFESVMKFNTCLNETFKSKNIFYFDRLSLSSIGKSYLVKDCEDRLMFNERELAKYLYTIYKGGRNECFFLGNEKNMKDSYFSKHQISDNEAYAHKIDINSSYPSVMCGDLPGKFLGIKDIAEKDIESLSTEFIYLYNFFIKYQPKNIPLLGVPHEKKLIFPRIGNFRYVQMWDFEYEKIKSEITFEPGKKIQVLIFNRFDGYKEKIEDLFEKRRLYKKTNKPLEQTIKILLNGSYGSLGMKVEREQMYMCKGSKIDRIKEKFTNYTEHEGPEGWKVFITKEDCEVNAITQQAAYITAKARFNLWDKLIEIKTKGGVPLYCDTDSIIFCGNIKNISGLDPTKLGAWKHEGSEKVWEIRGLKIYRFGMEVHCKGVRIPPSHLPKKQNHAFHFRDEYTESSWFVSRKGYIERRLIKKRITYAYTKGFMLSTGEVKPFEI